MCLRMQKFMCVFHIHKKDVKEYSPTTEENLERENRGGKEARKKFIILCASNHC